VNGTYGEVGALKAQPSPGTEFREQEGHPHGDPVAPVLLKDIANAGDGHVGPEFPVVVVIEKEQPPGAGRPPAPPG